MSEEKLAHYSFVPFVRKGLSQQINEADTLGSGISGTLARASVNLEARVRNGGDIHKVPKTLQVIGPGDVTGVQARAIVKTEPRTGVRDFEANYLPYIEFYEEDFPWRYTPATHSGHKLRPWLVLLVLKAEEFSHQAMDGGPLHWLRLKVAADTVFPDPEESWAWAHVHANADLDPTDSGDAATAMTELRGLLKTDADSALSRLIAPRKLEAETAYTAFLVPAFETGRLAGLGESILETDAQLPSWGPLHSSSPTDFPYYYSWGFATGSAGDFETLAEALEPVELPEDVGERPMDLQEAGYGLSYTHGDGTVELPGALRNPAKTTAAPLAFSGAPDFGKALAKRVNIARQLQTETGPDTGLTTGDLFGYSSSSSLTADPVIAPPLYGRWHARVSELDPASADTPSSMDWVHELNMDPRYRAAAGMGAEVVRRNQEAYMQACWAQIGEVLEANRKLQAAQLAKETSSAMFRKHLRSQAGARLLAITAPLQGKILHAGRTVRKNLQSSKAPASVFSPTFTRLFRPSSQVMARISPGANLSLQTQLATGLGNGSIAAVPTRVLPVNLRSVRRSSLYSLSRYALYADVSNFSFALQMKGVTRLDAMGNQEAEAFKTAVSPFRSFTLSSRWRDTDYSSNLEMTGLTDTILSRIDPLQAIRRGLSQLLSYTKGRGTADHIDPIMAHPALRVALYEPLQEISAKYLVPGIDQIPNNSVSLLEVDHKFIESFMVGANHEMMRELLWREYPTDQRGTPFQYFWDSGDYGASLGLTPDKHAEAVLDINKVHSWGKGSALGTHNPRGSSSTLVLVIRGDLLRKYPNTVIYAREADWARDGGGTPDYDAERVFGTAIKEPLFAAQMAPDLTMVGFDLTAEEALGAREGVDRSPGWFFTLMERPGEVHFGLDTGAETTAKVSTWKDLTWGHVDASSGSINLSDTGNPASAPAVDGVAWGENSANMASILFQDPVLVAIHASKMLPETL